MILKLKNVLIFDGEVAVSFCNGQEAYVTTKRLREFCPCAHCQGEPDVLGRVIVKKIDYTCDSYQIAKFINIGGYALQFYWCDGHSSGIYSYKYITQIANNEL